MDFGPSETKVLKSLWVRNLSTTPGQHNIDRGIVRGTKERTVSMLHRRTTFLE
jgi:hypothetical protein